MAHPIKHFFVTNGLPWNTSIEQSLHEDGYDTVELLKVMEEDEWSALFTNEKKAKRRLALTVFQDLRDAPVNTSNCATEIPFTPSSETTASASTSSKKKRKKKNHTDDNNDIHKMEKFGFFLKKHKKNTPTQHWSNPLRADDNELESDSDPLGDDDEGSDVEDDTRELGLITVEEKITNDDSSTIYISQEKMKELDIEQGDTVLIESANGQTTHCIVLKMNNDDGVGDVADWADINGVVRDNLGIEYGDTVALTLVDIPYGIGVSIRPIDVPPGTIKYEKSVDKYFHGA